MDGHSRGNLKSSEDDGPRSNDGQRDTMVALGKKFRPPNQDSRLIRENIDAPVHATEKITRVRIYGMCAFHLTVNLRIIATLPS